MYKVMSDFECLGTFENEEFAALFVKALTDAEAVNYRNKLRVVPSDE